MHSRMAACLSGLHLRRLLRLRLCLCLRRRACVVVTQDVTDHITRRVRLSHLASTFTWVPRFPRVPAVICSVPAAGLEGAAIQYNTILSSGYHAGAILDPILTGTEYLECGPDDPISDGGCTYADPWISGSPFAKSINYHRAINCGWRQEISHVGAFPPSKLR